MSAVVREALAQLTEMDREVLILVVLEGLTPGEAAEALGCTRATFDVRLHRARRRFTAAYERVQPARRTPDLTPCTSFGEGESR